MKHLMQSDIVFVTLALIVTIAALIFAFMVIAALVTLLGNLAHDTGKLEWVVLALIFKIVTPPRAILPIGIATAA